MEEVTLMQILQAREDRAMLQQKLLQDYGSPIISFTMNIAGPIKTSPLIERAFRVGLALLDEKLSGKEILYRDIKTSATGCQALYSVSGNAAILKKICTAIEEATPLGRLFDMDVLAVDGSILHRDDSFGHTRGCIVCKAPGRACAARRLHTVAQLQNATQAILTQHFADADADFFASLAAQSLIDEVCTTPKPGLVDQRNTGSHRDMSLSTFLASAHALRPYFKECVILGQASASSAPADTFNLLRKAGLGAEQTMLKATGGVNTHKGIIFTLGILCGSLGRLWTPETPLPPLDTLLQESALIAQTAVKTDFANPSSATAGLRLFREAGITGIRGEAAAGLPSVRTVSLPAYQNALEHGLSLNHARVTALLHLIASVTDTNLYHRGGPQGAAFAKESVQLLLSRSPFPTLSEVEALDDAFIAQNLSPGGCADLLAVTCFLFGLFSPSSQLPPFHFS